LAYLIEMGFRCQLSLGRQAYCGSACLKFDSHQSKTDQHIYQVSSAYGSVPLAKTTLPYL
jgi:hypothetical protein